MQILAISGSLRTGSENSSLVRTLRDIVPYNVTVSIYDRLGELPPFNPDLDDDSPPPPVVHMRQLLRGADAVLLCTPEYIHGTPGILKNALDWTASSGEFVDKPVRVRGYCAREMSFTSPRELPSPTLITRRTAQWQYLLRSIHCVAISR